MPHDDSRPTLGDVIKARRLELGWTQIDLADRVAARGDPAFRQSDVSRLERGNVTLPHRVRLERIAIVLGLPLGELLERSGWSGWIASDAPPGERADSSTGDASGQIAVDGAARRGVRGRTERPMASPQLAEALQQAKATLSDTERVLERSEAMRLLFQQSVRKEDDRRSPPRETA